MGNVVCAVVLDMRVVPPQGVTDFMGNRVTVQSVFGGSVCSGNRDPSTFLGKLGSGTLVSGTPTKTTRPFRSLGGGAKFLTSRPIGSRLVKLLRRRPRSKPQRIHNEKTRPRPRRAEKACISFAWVPSFR